MTNRGEDAKSQPDNQGQSGVARKPSQAEGEKLVDERKRKEVERGKARGTGEMPRDFPSKPSQAEGNEG